MVDESIGYVDKRLRYSDGQLLTAQDLTDEQAYHLDRQRRLGRALRVTGCRGVGGGDQGG